MLIHNLEKKDLIHPPDFLADNTQYLCIMGSTAYGVEEDTSDFDIYGFCIPKKETVFPHLAGEIQGFGRQIKRFEQWQEHKIFDKEAQGGKGREYDFSIYNIVKYFQLCMENNPNMIDSLFVPRSCVLHSTEVANMVRDKRRMFLHKGAFHKFKGYSFSQVHKMKLKSFKGLDKVQEFEQEHNIHPKTSSYHIVHLFKNYGYKFDDILLKSNEFTISFEESGLIRLSKERFLKYAQLYCDMLKSSGRAERVKVNGFDHKFAYHCVRLLDEAEQILIEHDIDLQRNREMLKSIRRGEWTLERVENYFETKERELETLYINSSLRHSPDESEIKELLLNCLEHHYGSLDNVIRIEGREVEILKRIKEIVKNY